MTNLMKALIASAAVAVVGSAAVANTTFEDFSVNGAILNPMTDLNDDGDVSVKEIIRANEAVFDINGDGAIDAAERGEAEQWIDLQLG